MQKEPISETMFQKVVKFIPLLITIGGVVITLANALIYLRTDTVRQEVRDVKWQHEVMAQELIDHKTTQNKTEEQLLQDVKEIKQDIKILLQRR